MPQTNSSRRHSQNVNTDRVEYHYIEDISQPIIDSAVSGYSYIPAPEAITLISTQPKIIKIEGYHYRLIGTAEPSGQTWNSGNTFTALYTNNAYIGVYTTVSATSPDYLKIGTDTKGYKYYQRVNETAYYELIGKMPNELEYGEVGVGRSANNEVMYIKNSDGQMVEFRSYKANMDYVNNEITDVYNLIYSIHYSPSWGLSTSLTGTPYSSVTIFKSPNTGTGTTVYGTASLSFNGTSETDFSASAPTNPSTWTQTTTTGTQRKFSNTIKTTSNSLTISTTITKDVYSKTLNATLYAVNHIFYGKSSATDTTSLTGLTAFTSAVTSPNGRNYQVTMAIGDYFYIAVPSSLTQPSQVGTGGASGFFESLSLAGIANVGDTITGVSEEYKFYRTQSGQAAGTFNYYVK